MSNPGKYVHNNVAGTLSILEAMRSTGMRNIVVSSTAAVYGIVDAAPSRLAVVGRYALFPDIFEYLDKVEATRSS